MHHLHGWKHTAGNTQEPGRAQPAPARALCAQGRAGGSTHRAPNAIAPDRRTDTHPSAAPRAARPSSGAEEESDPTGTIPPTNTSSAPTA